ncbi:MAG: DsbA family protein [Gammaproteobacteria bacterium]|jgi:2-hydroxychromene-2-carboxylate isomerase|nr:DsbA family protein [Gammaproteobacteria bacterium]
MQTVELFFDFSCPWSYLALLRLQDVCERNRARLLLRPVDVQAVLATEAPALAASRWSENPAKAAWQQHDLQIWANFWGLTLTLPASWPQPAAEAGAAALAVVDTPAAISFCREVFRQAFAEGRDPNTAATLAAAAAHAGADTAAVAQARDSTECREQLDANTRELVRRGGFGTPSVFVDDALFFGNDRVPLVEWTLGPMGDEEFVIPGQHDVY